MGVREYTFYDDRLEVDICTARGGRMYVHGFKQIIFYEKIRELGLFSESKIGLGSRIKLIEDLFVPKAGKTLVFCFDDPLPVNRDRAEEYLGCMVLDCPTWELYLRAVSCRCLDTDPLC